MFDPRDHERAQANGDEDRVRAGLISCLVALAFRQTPDEILASTRGPPECGVARKVALYLAHTGLQLSLERVAAAFGRDRSTVGHACRAIEDLRDDPAFDGRLSELEACLRHAPATSGAAA